MKKKLIAIDLDGTLLNSQIKISKENKEALIKASKRGILIVPATGRVLAEVPDELLTLPGIRYVITSNGASVVDLKEKKQLLKNQIEPEEVKKMLPLFSQYDLFNEAYIDGKTYVLEDCLEHLKDYAIPKRYHPLFLKTRERVKDQESYNRMVLEEGVEKFNIFFKEMQDRDRLAQDLENDPSFEINLTIALEYNLEVNAITATKGNALAMLCDHLGIKQAETMAFGDSLNDLSMLKYAGLSVGMKNGHPDLKAAADIIADTNDQNGVAKSIEAFILQPELEDEKLLFVEYPQCSTCRKARKFLEAHEIPFEKRHILEAPLSETEIKALMELYEGEKRQFFNTHGKVYREMGLKNTIKTMGEEEMIHLLASNGMLLKRPIVKKGKKVIVGFKEQEWEIFVKGI